MVSEIKTDTVLIEFNFFKKEKFSAQLSDEHGTINVQINYTANDFQTLATYDSFVSQIRDKWREFLKLKEQKQKQKEREQGNTGSEASAVETVVSRKRVYDYNDSNDEQPSTADVVVVAAAETSNATNATVELESTRRMSLRTKKAANYSEMDEEAASSPSTSDEAASSSLMSEEETNSSSMSEEETNSSSMSETEAESSPATTSKSTKQRKKFYK